uniref:Uncharacterized protein n=1 Tax=Parascaris univalens TaxID=6257 RepID=A0A915AG71_PARUN
MKANLFGRIIALRIFEIKILSHVVYFQTVNTNSDFEVVYGRLWEERFNGGKMKNLQKICIVKVALPLKNEVLAIGAAGEEK